jgi:23S rRNA (guanosine2251-2'-O)-methyltransferase
MAIDKVFGQHAVMLLFTQGKRPIHRLLIEQFHQKQYQEIILMAYQKAIDVAFVSMKEIEGEVGKVVHQGIVAMTETVYLYDEKDFSSLLSSAKQAPLVLILDGLTDPHNVGACLRTADGMGVDFVVLPKDKSSPINATVAKVASGALESVPIVMVTNLATAMKSLQALGVWIYGASGKATKPITAIDFKGAVALVMGREGDGMRRLTEETCDDVFYIPMNGVIESYNVSVATGMSLYEVMRQRN